MADQELLEDDRTMCWADVLRLRDGDWCRRACNRPTSRRSGLCDHCLTALRADTYREDLDGEVQASA